MIDQRYRAPVALSLMGAGIVVAILGYLGVSSETEVAFQLPFFASGAVGALLLFSAGAVLLLSTQLQADTDRLDELEDAVRSMAAELGRLADAERASTTPRAQSAGPSGGAGSSRASVKYSPADPGGLMDKESSSQRRSS